MAASKNKPAAITVPDHFGELSVLMPREAVDQAQLYANTMRMGLGEFVRFAIWTAAHDYQGGAVHRAAMSGMAAAQ